MAGSPGAARLRLLPCAGWAHRVPARLLGQAQLPADAWDAGARSASPWSRLTPRLSWSKLTQASTEHQSRQAGTVPGWAAPGDTAMSIATAAPRVEAGSGCEFLSEDNRMIREAALRIAREVIEPTAAARDREARWPTDELRVLGEQGFMGMLVPEEYGGSGS